MKRSKKTSASPRATALVPGRVKNLHAYVPGEQPKIRGLIKLNTNENPFPPSPRVLAAIRKAADGRMRLYPDPAANALRERLARIHGCGPEHVIVGNGSDDLLTVATRAFVEPRGAARSASAATVQFFSPSYSLYPVLADIQGALARPVALRQDFGLPGLSALSKGGSWDSKAALTFVTTPNAPSGRGYATRDLDRLCRNLRGVVVLDEAYADFAKENAMALAMKHPHVLVSRTFSKAYSLCYLRVGYFVGPADLIAAMHKVRDSYNVNGMGQVAAMAALEDLVFYRENFKRILATRERLALALTGLGFEVFPSQTNFVLVKPPVLPARDWLDRLRDRKILVRWFASPEVSAYLRITIGTDREVDALLRAVRWQLGRM